MKLVKLSQLSTDKWYLFMGRGDPIKFRKSKTVGWLRRDFEIDISTRQSQTIVIVQADDINDQSENFVVRRRADDYLFIGNTWFEELDVERYEQSILADLCLTYNVYQEKKVKVTDILRKLNPTSVV